MDSNLPPQTQPPTDPTSSPNISGRKNIIIISILVVAGLLLGSIFYINSKKSSSQKTPQASVNLNTVPPTGVTLKASQGTVSSITKDKITIASGSATSEFIIDNFTAVGTTTEKVAVSDVKVGQNVSITSSEGSNLARLILILK